MTKARIYKPSKTAMQSGRGRARQWVLEYELLSRREPEPLMGWQESEDTLNQVRLEFDTLEHAIERAEKEGWEYSVASDHHKSIPPKNYGDNFKYRPYDEGKAS